MGRREETWLERAIRKNARARATIFRIHHRARISLHEYIGGEGERRRGGIDRNVGVTDGMGERDVRSRAPQEDCLVKDARMAGRGGEGGEADSIDVFEKLSSTEENEIFPAGARGEGYSRENILTEYHPSNKRGCRSMGKLAGARARCCAIGQSNPRVA